MCIACCYSEEEQRKNGGVGDSQVTYEVLSCGEKKVACFLVYQKKDDRASAVGAMGSHMPKT